MVRAPALGNRLEAVATQLKLSRAEPSKAIILCDINENCETGAFLSVQCSHCDERFMGRIALLEHVYERHQETSVDAAEDGDLKLEPDDGEDTHIERSDTASDGVQTGSRAETIQVDRAAESSFQSSESFQCQQCDLVCYGQVAYLEHVFEAHQVLPDNPQEIPVETADNEAKTASRAKDAAG